MGGFFMRKKNNFTTTEEYYKSTRSFAQKVRQKQSVTLFELVPPSIETAQNDIEKSVASIISLLKKIDVDGINIPEVQIENRHGTRNSKVTQKIEPRILCKYLFEEGFLDVIINRPIVYAPWENQRIWLKETYDRKIRNFVFVGGESSNIQYPGVSVVDALHTVKQTANQDFPEIFLGGISIPTRKFEAQRMLRKTRAGIEFFTTQILYESKAITNTLQDYWDLCCQNGTDPKMVFLSFAPVTTIRDIELLTWLGVKIPQRAIAYLTSGWLGMGYRSLSISQIVLENVFQFLKKQKIYIPIGLNVGYINRHNFEFSIAFLKQLTECYNQNQFTGEHRFIKDAAFGSLGQDVR